MGNKPSLEAAGHNIFQYFLVSAVQAVQVCTIGEVLEYLKLSSSIEVDHFCLPSDHSSASLQSGLYIFDSDKLEEDVTLHLNVAWIEATCQAGMETHLGWNREWH